ncbi:hypothetical protein KUF71_003243 [Frankliniella fusca]|uniref:Uncharacterized protein n=1 Tax=Frankliniella fusca TaxID=407009 RepID=A0AAE1GST0_9NEOP|nr:hypothetical protein KUF71_003243 [Frankliniella fusca]
MLSYRPLLNGPADAVVYDTVKNILDSAIAIGTLEDIVVHNTFHQDLGDENLYVGDNDTAVLEGGEGAPLPARKSNPDKWKRNQAKEARNAGKAYVSLRGREVPAAAIGPRCGKGCVRDCKTFSDEDRQKVFDAYYKLSDRTAKWRFLSSLVRSNKIKNRTVIVHDSSEARKQVSSFYFLPTTNQAQVQVCQTMFTNSLGITMQPVKTALKRRMDKCNVVSPSKMGKKAKRTNIDKHKEETARKHIERFPAVESHYCRKGSTIRYIDEKLNR